MPLPPSKETERGFFKKVWRKHNQLVEYVQSLPVRPGRNVFIRHTTQGQMLDVTPGGATAPPGEPGTIKRYLLRSVENDHLICDEVDGAAGVLIAKPWRLRRSPFHGVSLSFIDERNRTYTSLYTYTSSILRRVVVNGVEPGEFQVVIPRYKPDFDYIFASTAENGTGVSVTTGSGPTAVTTAVELIDINADGRAWARER